MWITSADAWLLFFRIGFLLFMVLCTAAGFVFCAHLVIDATSRLITKAYGVAAIVEASRELRKQGNAPSFKRYLSRVDKHPL
jgi:uncharacterized protein YgbK (DUF1537 family)